MARWNALLAGIVVGLVGCADGADGPGEPEPAVETVRATSTASPPAEPEAGVTPQDAPFVPRPIRLRLVPPVGTDDLLTGELRRTAVRLAKAEERPGPFARIVANLTVDAWDENLEALWHEDDAEAIVTVRERVLELGGTAPWHTLDVGDAVPALVVREVRLLDVPAGTVDGEARGAELLAEIVLEPPLVAVAEVTPAAALRDVPVRFEDGGVRGNEFRLAEAEGDAVRLVVFGTRPPVADLVIGAEGARPFEIDVPWPEDTSRVADLGRIDANAPRVLRGRVVDGAGRPVEGQRVLAARAFPVAGEVYDEAISDADGRFELTPPVNAEVVVFGRGAKFGRANYCGPFDVGRSRAALEAVVRDQPVLRLAVVGPDGPFEGPAQLELEAAGSADLPGAGITRGIQVEAGSAEVALLPGSWAGTVHIEGGASSTFEAELSEGTLEVKVRVGLGGASGPR